MPLSVGVLVLTVLLSLVLAAIFIVLFWHDRKREDFSSAERAALLPLEDEKPVPPASVSSRSR